MVSSIKKIAIVICFMWFLADINAQYFSFQREATLGRIGKRMGSSNIQELNERVKHYLRALNAYKPLSSMGQNQLITRLEYLVDKNNKT